MFDSIMLRIHSNCVLIVNSCCPVLECLVDVGFQILAVIQSHRAAVPKLSVLVIWLYLAWHNIQFMVSFVSIHAWS